MPSLFWLPYQSNTSLKEKFLLSLIVPIIKDDYCYDAWKCVTRHCENGSSQIPGIVFDKSYSPVAHSDSFRINISIAAIYKLTDSIFYVSNAFHNKLFPIHERVCVNPLTYYLDWFEISYPNVPLNLDEGTFFLQRINGIQGTKLAGRKWN